MSALRFVDFTIRAWREGQFVQVIAHSTPAGGMRQPVAVKIGPFASEDYRLPIDASLAQGAALGRRLARLILPAEVWALLDESLVAVAPRPELGLRLRLCLDDDLIDLPWELLYRPDVDAAAASSGFLLTDGRVSLVREPPSVVSSVSPSDRTRRGLFVGAFFDDGSDGFGVTLEHQSLARAMQPLKGLLAFEFARADDSPEVERAFASGCDVFHYAGHTEVEESRGHTGAARSQRRHAATGERRDGGPRRGGRGARALGVERHPRVAPGPWRHPSRRVQRVQQRLLALRAAAHASGRPAP